MAYTRDLGESNEDRVVQAARAILAAVYDPINTQANWPDVSQLNRDSFQRLLDITALAVANVRNLRAPGDVTSEEADKYSHMADA